MLASLHILVIFLIQNILSHTYEEKLKLNPNLGIKTRTMKLDLVISSKKNYGRDGLNCSVMTLDFYLPRVTTVIVT